MAGAINEPVEDAPEDTKDSDLVNAIANVATEAGLGNMSVGLDTQGVTVNIGGGQIRSEEHTSELQSLMRNSYAVFCLKKKTNNHEQHNLTEERLTLITSNTCK